MGFGDVFEKIFDNPEIARRANAQNNTRRALANQILRTQEQNRFLQSTFDPLQAASAGSATARMRRRAANAASSAVATGSPTRPTSFSEAIGDAQRRTAARQQIQRQTEPRAQGQGLQERLDVARRGVQRGGRTQQGLASALNIREGVNLGVAAADALVNQSRADLAGGLLGSVAGVLADEESRKRLGGFLGGIGRTVGGIFGGGSAIPAPGSVEDITAQVTLQGG